MARLVAAVTRPLSAALFGALVFCPQSISAASIDLQPVVGVPGGLIRMYGVLNAMGDEVAGVQIDMTPGSGLTVLTTDRGRPACRSQCSTGYPPPPAALPTGGQIGGPASPCTRPTDSAAFLPAGCTPGVDCTGIRHLELSLNSVDPLPDGGTIFICTFQIDPSADLGQLEVACGPTLASDPTGQRIEDTTCSPAVVDVVCPGDCDADGTVTVAEVVSGFGIAHGETPISACRALDADASDSVTIGELVRGRNSVLGACGD
jgi:hypothetical protein